MIKSKKSDALIEVLEKKDHSIKTAFETGYASATIDLAEKLAKENWLKPEGRKYISDAMILATVEVIIASCSEKK